MNTYIPNEKISTIIASNKIDEKLIEFIKNQNINIIFTKDIISKSPIADHPDIAIFLLTENKIIVEKSVISYYKNKFFQEL